MAVEEATQLYERRAAELKRQDLCGRRPFPKVGRPTFAKLVRERFDSAGAY